MLIFHSLESLPSNNLALTIGNFDALHLGHQTLLAHLKKKGSPTVVSFSNHSSTILSNTSKLSILTPPHKLKLLEEYGVENLFLIPFTTSLSQQSAEEFLTQLWKQMRFRSLILGADARIGHKRHGDETMCRSIASKLGFEIEYLPKLSRQGNIVSSSQIRSLLQEGQIEKASVLLGRPYSLYGNVERGAGNGEKFGFRTMNVAVDGLSLPPLGVWKVFCIHEHFSRLGLANLGFAPTVRQKLLLEVHIPNFQKEVYGTPIEVVFHQFLRPEKKFLSLDELKAQISLDLNHI